MPSHVQKTGYGTVWKDIIVTIWRLNVNLAIFI